MWRYKLLALRVHEASPEINVHSLGRTVVAHQRAHAQEMKPRDIHFLLVSSMEAYCSKNSMLDRRVFIFQKSRRIEEEF